jgi:hypothetical protein
MCDKAQAKSLKAAELGGADSASIAVLAVDVHEVRDTKSSFKKLCKACVPSASQSDSHLVAADQQTVVVESALASQRLSHSHLTIGGKKSTTGNNFRRSSQKKFSRLTTASQFSTSINVNASNNSVSSGHHAALTSHASQSSQLAAAHSAVGFHKLLNDSKWFEQLQVSS